MKREPRTAEANALTVSRIGSTAETAVAVDVDVDDGLALAIVEIGADPVAVVVLGFMVALKIEDARRRRRRAGRDGDTGEKGASSSASTSTVNCKRLATVSLAVQLVEMEVKLLQHASG
jgi:hypothetical protein